MSTFCHGPATLGHSQISRKGLTYLYNFMTKTNIKKFGELFLYYPAGWEKNPEKEKFEIFYAKRGYIRNGQIVLLGIKIIILKLQEDYLVCLLR